MDKFRCPRPQSESPTETRRLARTDRPDKGVRSAQTAIFSERGKDTVLHVRSAVHPLVPLSSESPIMLDVTITGYETHDVRFPTSLTGDGTDAM